MDLFLQGWARGVVSVETRPLPETRQVCAESPSCRCRLPMEGDDLPMRLPRRRCSRLR